MPLLAFFALAPFWLLSLRERKDYSDRSLSDSFSDIVDLPSYIRNRSLHDYHPLSNLGCLNRLVAWKSLNHTGAFFILRNLEVPFIHYFQYISDWYTAISDQKIFQS